MKKINIDKMIYSEEPMQGVFTDLAENVIALESEEKIICVTSCNLGEGKSTVAINLASFLATSGKRVLFIDGDMSKSSLAGKYKLSNNDKGLSSFLSGVASFDEIIFATNQDNLYIVMSGPVPSDRIELLDSRYFRAMMKQLKKVYDYVIIDSSSLSTNTDSSLIGKYSDGVMFVVASQETNGQQVAKYRNQLIQQGINIVGVVLNKADDKR